MFDHNTVFEWIRFLTACAGRAIFATGELPESGDMANLALAPTRSMPPCLRHWPILPAKQPAMRALDLWGDMKKTQLFPQPCQRIGGGAAVRSPIARLRAWHDEPAEHEASPEALD